MRIRSVYPALWTSLPVASLSIPARLTWVGLWNYADDEGRGKDDARLVKAALWALDEDMTVDEIEGYITEIAAAGLVHRYEVDDRRWFHVPTWSEHQRPKKPSPSRIPRCPRCSPSADEIGGTSNPTSNPTGGEGVPQVVSSRSSRVGRSSRGTDPLSKYLDKLHALSPIFANVDRDWLLEMTAAKGFTEADTVNQLYEACEWWTNRASPSQRAKKDGRRTLQVWFNNTRKWANENGGKEPVATDPVAHRRKELADELPRRLADLGKKSAQDAARQTLERFPDGDLDFLERIARRDYGEKR